MFPPKLPDPQYGTHYERAQAECSQAYEVWDERGNDGSFIKSTHYDGAKKIAQKEKHVRDWCDLAAQHLTAKAGVEAANYARFTWFATALGVVLLAGTLWETRRAAKGVLNDQRPWLKIASFGIEDDEYLPFVMLKNVGKSPAVEVEIRAVIIVRPQHSDEFSERIRITEQCGSQNVNHAVLPGDIGRFVMHYDIHRHYEDATKGGEHMYCILIDYKGVGCNKGRSFGIWHSIEYLVRTADHYEEDERARQYT